MRGLRMMRGLLETQKFFLCPTLVTKTKKHSFFIFDVFRRNRYPILAQM